MELKQVIDGIFNGIRAADNKHRKWTNGWFLDTGPEYFMVSNMAEEIMKQADNEMLFFEYSLNKINSCEIHAPQGRPPKCFKNKAKFDIAILNSQYHMKYIIEAKDVYGFPNTFEKDLERLEWITKQYSFKEHKGSLKAGIFACYTTSVTQKEECCKDNLFNRIKEYRNYYTKKNVVWSEHNFTEPYYDKINETVSLGTYFCIIVH